MTTTEQGGTRPLTIHNATVSILAIRVDGKPMTISVYNQLPTDAWDRATPGKDATTFLGYINRCHRDCESDCEATHIFATLNDQPCLRLITRGNENRRATIRGIKYRVAKGETLERDRMYYWPAEDELPPHQPAVWSQGGWQEGDNWERLQAITAAAHREIARLQILIDQEDTWWSTHIAPLPQVYVAA